VGTAALLGIVLFLGGLMALDGLANGRLYREVERTEPDRFVIEGFEDLATSTTRTRVMAFGHVVSTGREIPGGISLANDGGGFQAGDTVVGYLIPVPEGERFITEGTVDAWKPVWHVGSFYFSFLFVVAVVIIAFFLGLAYLMLFVDLEEEAG
jgi:hypothetical protein